MGRRTGNDGLENHLRELRAVRGWTQAMLAERAGITRQAVKSIETGQYTPNTTVALRLAQALGCRVEEIFRLQPDGPEMRAETVGEQTIPGDRMIVSRVGARVVSRPLIGAHSLLETLVPADAIATGQETVKLLRPEDYLDRTALILGCDPSLSVLCDRVSRTSSGVRLVWLHASSQSALDATAGGTAHIAGAHLPSHGQDENLQEARKALSPTGGIVVTYAAWPLGFIVARGNPLGIRRIEDLARAGTRFINREPGAGSRKLADQLLQQAGIPAESVPGYETEAPSHAAVARAVATGLADAGVGLELVANAFGLGFIPLAEVRFDLAIPAAHLAHPAISALMEVLQSATLRAELAALPGYSVARTGSTLADIPAIA